MLYTTLAFQPPNYNQTLIGWSSLPTLQSSVPLGANGLEYCDATARSVLTDTHGWTITGDTQVADCNATWFINTPGDQMYTTSEVKMGINTTTPMFPLDVNGTVNATELLMNGETFTSSWTQNGNDLICGGQEMLE